MLALLEAFAAGNIEQAQKSHHKLFPLCRDMLGLPTNPIPVKAAMGPLGRDCGPVKLPLTPLSDSELASLKQTLQDYGLTLQSAA